MELLWERMGDLYGHKWESAFGSEPSEGWDAALHDIEPQMIKHGLMNLAESTKHRDWPPSALEFRALCLPRGEDMGLPTEAEALRQATGSSTQKHPAVSFTLRNMGDDVFALRRADSKTAASMFGPHWAATIKHVMAGGELPEPAPEIDYRHTKADRAEGNSFLAEMRAEVGAS